MAIVPTGAPTADISTGEKRPGVKQRLAAAIMQETTNLSFEDAMMIADKLSKHLTTQGVALVDMAEYRVEPRAKPQLQQVWPTSTGAYVECDQWGSVLQAGGTTSITPATALGQILQQELAEKKAASTQKIKAALSKHQLQSGQNKNQFHSGEW